MTEINRRTFLKSTSLLGTVTALTGFHAEGLLRTITAEEAQTQQAEQRVISAHDIGPFYAIVKNERWVRTEPLEPNLAVGHNVYAARARTYAPDRIRYPMKRVDFSTDSRNTQNRGTLNFVRIPWDDALDLVASEIQRVIDTYGNSALYIRGGGHQWAVNLHRGHTWRGRLFGPLGGYTTAFGGHSTIGWQGGGPLTWGSTAAPSNNYIDILENCRMVIFWGTDPVSTSLYYSSMHTEWRFKLKEAGIKVVSIETRFNDTAALHGYKFIALIPGTDEALMLAIAYVWITEDLYDKEYVAAHTVGFEEFEKHVLGMDNTEPKTPGWAASKTGVDEDTIIGLAREWALGPTFIHAYPSGANRRAFAGQFVRMLITLQAISGNIGRPGGGVPGGFPDMPIPQLRPKGMKTAGSLPGKSNPVSQRLEYCNFHEAVMTGQAVWTYRDRRYSYPYPGQSEIKLLGGTGGSEINQRCQTDLWVEALQSPNIEFVYTIGAWWDALPLFCDVVLPATHVNERDDITNWMNYVVYMTKVIDPLYESRHDMDIMQDLADKLGVGTEYGEGKSADEWLAEFFAKSNVPMTFTEFRQAGYYKFDVMPEDLEPSVGWEGFMIDPEAEPLSTPSGKIEIYSQRIADFYGPDDPKAPPIPKYIEPTRFPGKPLAELYPLQQTSPHSKCARHSQWRNMTWLRDEPQFRVKGYNPVRMNPIDAKARGIEDGDVVRVYNDLGQYLAAAVVTERAMPGVVWTWEGGWYHPQEPGVVGSLDLGGNANVVLETTNASPIVRGMRAHTGLVEVERWT
jgi:trimethylamine-N-oxide reductase (cytochrome c)